MNEKERKMIKNLDCGGFTFDAGFDSGNLAKVELAKVFSDGKNGTDGSAICYHAPNTFGLGEKWVK